MRRLTVYTKPACPLCEEVLDVVRELRETVEFDWETVDILGDPDLYERWKHAIPVGCVEGREVFRYRVTVEALRRALGSGDHGQGHPGPGLGNGGAETGL